MHAIHIWLEGSHAQAEQFASSLKSLGLLELIETAGGGSISVNLKQSVEAPKLQTLFSNDSTISPNPPEIPTMDLREQSLYALDRLIVTLGFVRSCREGISHWQPDLARPILTEIFREVQSLMTSLPEANKAPMPVVVPERPGDNRRTTEG